MGILSKFLGRKNPINNIEFNEVPEFSYSTASMTLPQELFNNPKGVIDHLKQGVFDKRWFGSDAIIPCNFTPETGELTKEFGFIVIPFKPLDIASANPFYCAIVYSNKNQSTHYYVLRESSPANPKPAALREIASGGFDLNLGYLDALDFATLIKYLRSLF